MKLPFYGIALIAICLFVSCSNGASYNKATAGSATGLTTNNAKEEDVTIASKQMADTASSASNTTEDIALQSGTPAFTDWDKKIIKTATVKLEVKDYNAFNSSIHNCMKSFGAYTAGEQQSQTNGLIQNNLTIKVPVDQFDALLNSIGGDGITILSKDVTTDDVSTELVDTKARIEAKKQLRDKYAELLKEAKNMKDILQVQDEINSIQEDLEAAAGRVNYLSHSAAYSTISINYFQYLTGTVAIDEQPSFFTSLKEAFATGSSVISHIFLFLISVWPLLLSGTLVYVYIKRKKVKKVTA